jgi:hypothetical protein
LAEALMRVLYRARQFWTNLAGKPPAAGLAQARQLLGPDLYVLFRQMQPGEQAHSIQVFLDLKAGGADDPDLLVAALLHDVGKARFRLHLWERVLVVLGKGFFPNRWQKWGQGEARGWKRAFVIAAQHPAWGAEMAASAGALPGAVRLIRCHQDALPQPVPESDRQLALLQRCDDAH